MKVIEHATLPDADAVGVTGDWVLPTDDGDDVVELRGVFLGLGTSHRPQHYQHRGRHAAPGERCAACRWFEPRIFRELRAGGQLTPGPTDPTRREALGRYLVHYAGRSVVPGEVTRSRHEWLSGPHEVIEALTTRRVASNEVFLTPPAARVLAQAANWDVTLEEAYVDRAVS